MMQFEFEKLAGRDVTEEQYKAFEILYNDSDLDKNEFVKAMEEILWHLPKVWKPGNYVFVGLEEYLGYEKMSNKSRQPILINGKYLTVRAEIVKVNIETGYVTLRKIPDIYFSKEFQEVDFFESDRKIVWEN